ncbi:MAG: winged helix-turn-helix domain-containing protein [Micromonosporaceae bacterium]|nr:winged helix-turn-helix domain-containing protein [Micromonosporaceae bacterium]
MTVRILMLGPLEAWHGKSRVALGGARSRRLLAALALEPGRTVALDTLIRAIWDDRPPATARGQVQTCVSALRGAFSAADVGGTVIESRPNGYAIAAGAISTDVSTFGDHLAAARQAVAAGQTEQGRSHYAAALALWRGPALAGVGGPVADGAAVRLEEQRLGALEDLFELRLALGETHELVGELREHARSHALRERPYELLMRAMLACGRAAEASAAYRQAYRHFTDELGVAPGPRLVALHQQALAEFQSAEGQGPAAPVASRPSRFQLPADLADFTGRDADLARLAEALVAPSEIPVTVALSGGGGVGKTSLAIHLGHHVAASFPDGRFFVPLRGAQADPADPYELLARMLRSLGVDPATIPSDGDERAALYRSLLAGQKVLIVLDDAADESQVVPLLPPTPGCAVVVTSRRRLGGLSAALHVDLGPLGDEEAESLVRRVVGDERAAQPAALRRLVKLCGGLPLALRIAGARLVARPHWTPERLVSALEDARLDGLTYGQTGVRASLALSLRGLDPVADRLFALLGTIDRAETSGWVAAALLQQPYRVAEAALERLADARLVEPLPQSGRFRLHDLVHAYAVEQSVARLSAPERRCAVTRVAERMYALIGRVRATLIERDPYLQIPAAEVESELAAEIDANPLAWYEGERHMVDALVRQCARLGLVAHSTDLAAAGSLFAAQLGYDDDWRGPLAVALRAARAAGDRHRTGLLLAELGNMHLCRFRMERGAVLLTRAMSHFDAVGDRYRHAVVRWALGYIDRYTGRLDRAARRCLTALPVLLAHCDFARAGMALRDIGYVHLAQGRPATALRYAHRAVDAKRAAGDRRGLPPALFLQGEAELTLGRLDDAERTFTLARGLAAEVSDIRGEAYLSCALGRVEARRRRVARAEALLRHAIEVARRVREEPAEREAIAALTELMADRLRADRDADVLMGT